MAAKAMRCTMQRHQSIYHQNETETKTEINSRLSNEPMTGSSEKRTKSPQ